jgi:hypothetical protein
MESFLMQGSLRGEAPRNSRVVRSGGRAAGLSPQKCGGVWGVAAPPVRIKFPWCTVQPKFLYRYKIDIAIYIYIYIYI